MGIPVVQCSRTYLVVATSLALEYPLLWVLRTLPVHNIVALINIIIPGHESLMDNMKMFARAQQGQR